MKALMLATVAVIMVLQMAEGKQMASLQLQNKLTRASKAVSTIIKAADQKSSRVTRQTFNLTCDEETFESFARRYPQDCASNFQNLDISGLEEGNFDAVADFVDVFCDARCGQPFVDLLYDCDLDEIATVLVYACRMNDDGDMCGAILQTLSDAGTDAENACLPPTVNCSTNCQNSLSAFRDMTGCCGNVTEIGGVFGVEVAISNVTIWDSCGVSVTGLCTRGALRGACKALAVLKVTLVGLAMLALVVMVLLL